MAVAEHIADIDERGTGKGKLPVEDCRNIPSVIKLTHKYVEALEIGVDQRPRGIDSVEVICIVFEEIP